MSTPCYYCELSRPQSCKVCIHGELDPDRIAELERQNAELRKDAERYRKWREVRGSHVGVPCACEFDDDGETLLRCCSAHKAIIDALTQSRELTDAVTPWQQRGRDGTARDDQRAMEDEIRELRALLSASKDQP